MGGTGESPRAFARAVVRLRLLAQLLVAVLLLAPPRVAVLDEAWAPPPAPDALAIGMLPQVGPPATSIEAPGEQAARAAPAARGLPPAPPAAVPGVQQPPPAGGVLVWASWYGPGLYGNRTACGQILSPASFGVAHRTLPCGTLVTITYAGRTLTAPVIDRGPYVAGRDLDLASGLSQALGFSGVHQVLLAVP